MNGKRVRFTITDEKGQPGSVDGVVTETTLPFGRIEVRDDAGNLHHVQPAWVEELS